MKVSKLIEELSKVDPDLDVVVYVNEELDTIKFVKEATTINGVPYTASGYVPPILAKSIKAKKELKYILLSEH